MGDLLYRLRYFRPLITVRSMARELAVYQRARRRPDRGPSLRFVIFGSGRTGSSLLMDLLNSHPEIECEDEILSHRVLNARRFLDARAELSRRPVFGFKLKLHHLTTQGITDPAAFLGRLHAGGCRIVHLARRDRLRQALSSAVARQRLAQHQTVAERRPRPGPFRIDVPWLIMRMRELDASLEGERATLAGLPHLALWYEDDLLRRESFQPTLDRVFDHLSLRPAPVSTEYLRTGTDRLADLVANLDEIREALRETEYAPLIRQLT
jgi:LPS sulfotransferase NodH